MGVDWLSCNNCGHNFPDCGDYVSCECGEHWCSEECAEKDGFQRDECKLEYEVIDGYEQNEECKKGHNGGCDTCENYIKGGCKYCREEDFEDEVLLDYALQKLGLSREDLIKQYKKYTGKS